MKYYFCREGGITKFIRKEKIIWLLIIGLIVWKMILILYKATKKIYFY